MNGIIKLYLNTPLIKRMAVGFVLGSLLGLLTWHMGELNGLSYKIELESYISPIGSLFIHMLKMVVIPIVFFTLILGASKLPISKLGSVGARLMGLYVLTSLISTAIGVLVAMIVNPGYHNKDQWRALTASAQSDSIIQNKVNSPGISDIIFSMFSNPFDSLANSNFLGIIVFAILLGLALSSVSDEHPKHISLIIDFFEGFNNALYKIVHWIMEYAPIGVFALSLSNFGIFGPAIIGPYFRVVGGIIIGIFVMVFLVYGLFVKLGKGYSPIKFFKECKEAMLTAFVTRSSAAALPISMQAAERLGISREVASFSLPLGATINMDGVCVHLPMFAILTANIFGIDLSAYDMVILVTTTVLAAIGTGGVPGGSLMLLFLILGALGLNEHQVAVVVSLALGVNPILDMFETMNNVTGDLMCAFMVGKEKEQ